MLDVGIIKQASSGMYNLLPLGLRALDKLHALVDKEMEKIGAQKILMPHLTPSSLWKKTGRLEEGIQELFMLADRHKREYILSPTYEEAITHLISMNSPLSPKTLPLRLYQISSKWRDEKKPRLGLLRGREFVMKDLYTFDVDSEKARETYESVCAAYDSIFQKIGVDFIKVIGHAGLIGGSHSHEYHYLSDVGEDNIATCPSCNYSANTEIHSESTCLKCQTHLQHNTAIEVGHTFLLGKKYSQPLNATVSVNGTRHPLEMGCFGLGLTRILAAAIEKLSTEEELRWPIALAPYRICIIPPKKGSKEELAADYAESFYKMINSAGIDAILDDRTEFTIGKRLLEAKRTGYPYIVVIGKRVIKESPLFEVHDLSKNELIVSSFEGVIDYLFTANDDKSDVNNIVL
ncbi:probable proline--tRNA ligase, mitochondrial isoform X2 [Athalia rosae]|nr:probable proline--tRNA ligase, mitochondrial isoform X2 [Athalia rosae]